MFKQNLSGLSKLMSECTEDNTLDMTSTTEPLDKNQTRLEPEEGSSQGARMHQGAEASQCSQIMTKSTEMRSLNGSQPVDLTTTTTPTTLEKPVVKNSLGEISVEKSQFGDSKVEFGVHKKIVELEQSPVTTTPNTHPLTDQLVTSDNQPSEMGVRGARNHQFVGDDDINARKGPQMTLMSDSQSSSMKGTGPVNLTSTCTTL